MCLAKFCNGADIEYSLNFQVTKGKRSADVMTAAANNPRRTPKQERGQDRVDALLNAAAALLAEGGIEALTTNAVAARAETHIGSLYHFFPNKEAILQALSARYLDDLRALWDTLFTADAMISAPTHVLIDTLIERFAEFELHHHGFNALFYGSGAPDAVQAVSAQIGGELIARIAGALALRYPDLSAACLTSAATLMLGAVKTILPNALPGMGAEAESLRYELKRMLRAYLDALSDHAG